MDSTFNDIDDLIPRISTKRISEVAELLVGSTVQESFMSFQFNLRTTSFAVSLPFQLVVRELQVRLIYNNALKKNSQEKQSDDEIFDTSLILASDTILAVQSQNPRMPVSMNANRLSCIVSLWTAFETLTGDLWEEVINYCPDLIKPLLAHNNYKNLKTAIDFEDLQTLDFDLKGKIGTLYKRQLKMQSLKDIRAIYVNTFGVDVENILKGPAITYLEALRHLVVHRAAIRDRKYLESDGTKVYDPEGKPGEYVLVPGTTVIEMAKQVENMGCDLLLYLRALLESRSIT